MDAHCLESSLEKLLREAQYGDTGTRDLVVGTLSLFSEFIDKLNERKIGIETSAPIEPKEALL